MDDLDDTGYDCEEVGFAWESGDGPSFNPFSDECEARRYRWDPLAGVGNGHIITIDDDLTDMIRESDEFVVVTDQDCF